MNINKIIEDYKSGMSFRKLGKKYGMDHVTIYQAIRKAGVDSSHGGGIVSAKQRKEERYNKWLANMDKKSIAIYRVGYLEAEQYSDLKARFRNHRNNAKRRKVPFLLSLPEWAKVWKDSGHMHEMGLGIGQYVMSRKGDVGAYSVDNVYIQKSADNVREYFSRLRSY